MKRICALLGLAAGLTLSASQVDAATAYAISNATQLIRFETDNPSAVTVIGSFSGHTEFMDGIDFRPADGQLYGYDSDTNSVVRINTLTAETTFVATPSTASTTPVLGIDFNPVPDRLRLVNTDQQNLRINLANGVTAVDGALTYAAGDPNEGATPTIVDAAYTNSFQPSPRATPGTRLYYIDSELDILVTTNSPNAGLLTTVGALGVDTTDFAGFDILSLSVSSNTAYAVFGDEDESSLYTIDLATGAATLIGSLNGVNGVYGLAVIPEPSSLALVALPAVIGFLAHRRRRLA